MSKKVLPPSRLHLPKLDRPPATVLEHLVAHFPHVEPSAWHDRVARGLVTFSDGTTLNAYSPYRHGITVCYHREVPLEPDSLLEETILYKDGKILVADKPHGMPVTPGGAYVERTLLTRLQRSTGLATLAPAHRLDRDTAGIVLFIIDPNVRAAYHRLFVDGAIDREYYAIAHVPVAPDRRQWRVHNRIEPGNPWYVQRIVEGPPNAITDIELLDSHDSLALFRLIPQTGKKHQLRVHMASLGFPIIGDPVYGRPSAPEADDPPLQLLARRLRFVDPFSQAICSFTSEAILQLTTNSMNYI